VPEELKQECADRLDESLKTILHQFDSVRV
jgi:hypothetical protein